MCCCFVSSLDCIHGGGRRPRPCRTYFSLFVVVVMVCHGPTWALTIVINGVTWGPYQRPKINR